MTFLRNGIGAALAVVAFAAIGEAQERTTVATEMTVQASDRELSVEVSAPVPDTADGVIGFLIVCERATGQLEAGFAFGRFPAGRAVQGVARSADGRALTFSPPVVSPDTEEWHVPDVDDRERIFRLMEVLFTQGASLSNGVNALRLQVPEDVNRDALSKVRSCADRAGGIAR